jgi:putative DNA primase/helicase
MGEYDDILPETQPEQSHTRPTPQKPSVVTPNIVRMCDVEPEAVKWLWPERIALGKLTVIAGDPGLGKSFLTIDLAARLSKGRDWPDGSQGVLGSAILVSGEDDPADTIRPRLDAADADVSRVEVLLGMTVKGDDDEPGRDRSISLKYDMQLIDEMLSERPECRLLIIDPLSAYLGEIDSHKNADVRSVLSPLTDLASRRTIAVVAVEHLNKRSGGSAIHRTQGSIGIVGAARAAYAVMKNPDNPESRLFLPTKNNLGNDSSGLSFKLIEHPGAMTACIAWSADLVTVTADDVMNRNPGSGRGSSVVDDAAEWLADYLANGPKAANEITEAAKGERHSGYAMKNAKKTLGVIVSKEGKNGPWVWSLPEGVEHVPEDDDTNQSTSSTPSEKHGENCLFSSPELEGVDSQCSTPSKINGTPADLNNPF